jgi:hypothetical protein
MPRTGYTLKKALKSTTPSTAFSGKRVKEFGSEGV